MVICTDTISSLLNGGGSSPLVDLGLGLAARTPGGASPAYPPPASPTPGGPVVVVGGRPTGEAPVAEQLAEQLRLTSLGGAQDGVATPAGESPTCGSPTPGGSPGSVFGPNGVAGGPGMGLAARSSSLEVPYRAHAV